MVPDLQSDAETADNNVVESDDWVQMADMDSFVEMDIDEAHDCVVVDIDGQVQKMMAQNYLVIDIDGLVHSMGVAQDVNQIQ